MGIFPVDLLDLLDLCSFSTTDKAFGSCLFIHVSLDLTKLPIWLKISLESQVSSIIPAPISGVDDTELTTNTEDLLSDDADDDEEEKLSIVVKFESC